jgi:putative spermidine/putrescine transport system permease protein
LGAATVITGADNATRLISFVSFAILAIFFLAPLAFMVVVSFYKSDPMAFYKVAFSTENYAKYFSSFYLNVTLRSLWSAGLSAVIVVALSFLAVLAIVELSRRWQLFWVILLLSLMCISEVIVGFSWLILLSESAGIPKFLETIGLWDDPRSLSPSFGAMMIGLVTLGLSIVSLVLFPELANRDRSIEEAALTLGTPPHRVMFNITLPIFAPTLIAMALTMFVYLLGVFVMPTMLGQPSDWTMTVMISDKALGDANLPLGAALAVAMLVITGVILLLSLMITRRQAK